jgi:hypothetical protein
MYVYIYIYCGVQTPLLGKNVKTNNEKQPLIFNGRLTCLYNNIITFGNGVMQPVARQLQQLNCNNGKWSVLNVIRAEEFY